MAKSKIFLDIETTGLEYSQGAVILSIGAVAELRGKKNLGNSVEFYGLICPTREEFAAASPEALQVNGLTWETLEANGKPFREVVEDFLRWLMEHKIDAKNYQYVGQNPNFDLGFLRFFLGDELDFVNFPFEDPLDIRDLYSILVSRRVMKYLKRRTGENISIELGVEPEPKIHNALEGARVVKRNYDRLVELGATS
jgi:DNA polymerase III epsilon subunit-like protein